MYGAPLVFRYERSDRGVAEVEIELCPPKDEAICAQNATEWINNNRTRLFLSSPRPCSLSFEEEWTRDNNKGDDIHWMIYVDGTHVGGIGLHRIEKEHGRAELGIMIGDQSYWGKGLAQVVVVAVMEYVFENIVPGGLHKLTGHVLVMVTDDEMGNARSQGMLQKVGFREAGMAQEHFWHQGRWYDQWTGEILRSEWAKVREEKFSSTGITHLDIYPGCQDIGFQPAVSG